MTKWEKVIQALELCIKGNEIHYCNKCPYKISDFNCDSKGFMKDALDLLKEQEPRVMTLQEAIDYGYDYGESGEDYDFPPVFIEYFDDRKCYVHWWVAAQVNMSLYQTVALREDYNKATQYGFRLWTSRPTEEQRKAVPWGTQKEE